MGHAVYDASAADVFATTNKDLKYKEISAYVVPTDAQGFSLGKKNGKLGIQ